MYIFFYKTITNIFISRAFPQQYACCASKEHVHHVLDFVCHLEAEPLAHNDVPGSAKLLIHCVLDHLGSRLLCQTEDETRISVTIINKDEISRTSKSFCHPYSSIATICVTKSRTGNYDFSVCVRARARAGFPR